MGVTSLASDANCNTGFREAADCSIGGHVDCYRVEENLLPEKMKASIFEKYGGPDVLSYTDFPVPQPRRGEALVKVHAVGLNGYDLMARAGRYKPNKGKFPHILGGDFGGELTALGPETTCDFPLGTRVTSWWILPCGRCEQCMAGHHNRCARDYRYLGAHEHGAYAEYVKLPAAHLIALPPNVSYESAAGFPNPFGTAWHMLIDRGRLRAGKRRVGGGRFLQRRPAGVSAVYEAARIRGGDGAGYAPVGESSGDCPMASAHGIAENLAQAPRSHCDSPTQ